MSSRVLKVSLGMVPGHHQEAALQYVPSGLVLQLEMSDRRGAELLAQSPLTRVSRSLIGSVNPINFRDAWPDVLLAVVELANLIWATTSVPLIITSATHS
jgi:hypothetical protein